MKIKDFTFGMRGHDLGSNFDEMINNALAKNITTLQFAPAKTMADIKFAEVGYDEKVADKMASAFTDNGIEISVLGCYIDPITEETLENNLKLFENFIPYAKAVNATVIGTETGYIPYGDKERYKVAYSVFMKDLERLLPVAERNGVSIGIEPVSSGVVCSAPVMKQILDYFKSDSLKVIFDPINILNIENYKNQKDILDEAFDLLGDKIAVFHLKDFIADDVYKKVPVGDGLFEAKYALDKLSKMKKTPNIILDEMPLSDLEKVTDYLNEIL